MKFYDVLLNFTRKRWSMNFKYFQLFCSGLETVVRGQVQRWFPPLNTQCFQNAVESEERSTSTLGTLCLLCYMRDTIQFNTFFNDYFLNFNTLKGFYFSNDHKPTTDSEGSSSEKSRQETQQLLFSKLRLQFYYFIQKYNGSYSAWNSNYLKQ